MLVGVAFGSGFTMLAICLLALIIPVVLCRREVGKFTVIMISMVGTTTILAVAAARYQAVDVSEMTEGKELITAYRNPAITYSEATVRCLVVMDDKTEAFPPLTLNPGESVESALSFADSVEFPRDFAFPEIADSEGDTYPITPSVAAKSEEPGLGWKLHLRVETRGSFLLLRGTLRHTRAGALIRAAGLPFQPIYTMVKGSLIGQEEPVVLTDNVAGSPSLVKEEFPIVVAAKPGQTCRVYFDSTKLRYAEFRIEITR